jgi:3-isopropylmalate/(R)-2-methylmalate dehydratase small subunit
VSRPRRVWTFGDNVDTDVITPSQYKHRGKEVYVAHAMEPIEPTFGEEVRPGDLIVAGRNFGSGSSRETAAIVFAEHGVEAIVAASFARIFYRNAINLGLPVYVSPAAAAGIEADHEVTIDHEAGVIHNGTTGETYEAEPHPPFIREILEAGGLAAYRERLHANADPDADANANADPDADGE